MTIPVAIGCLVCFALGLLTGMLLVAGLLVAMWRRDQRRKDEQPAPVDVRGMN